MDPCQDVMSAAHRFYIAFKNESEGEFAVDSPIFFSETIDGVWWICYNLLIE